MNYKFVDIDCGQHYVSSDNGKTMKPSLNLYMFTNLTNIIREKQTIFQTFNSFKNTFSEYSDIRPTCVYIDKNPLNDNKVLKGYISKIKEYINPYNIKIMNSYYDAFVDAVESSNSMFNFMLEHDFIFIKDRIQHNLHTCMQQMIYDNIHHLRFNVLSNFKNFNQHEKYNCYQEIKGKFLNYCTTKNPSNQPNLIRLDTYRKDMLPILKKYSGKKINTWGTEDHYYNSDMSHTVLAVYGDKNCLETIKHTEGRFLNI